VNIKIRNVIPLWIITLWITVGIVMFLSSIGWELLELIDEKECHESIPCLTFDILMFLTHYFGIFILVMGILSLLGNEKTTGTK
jgi:hypothetical protein